MAAEAEASGPALAGLRVIDLTRILAGPFCTQLLADHGAEIVKVEPPAGDETRAWGPPFRGGQSAYFDGLNRGKASIGVDLGRAAGRAALLRLLEGADVLVENFKPGRMEKWGLDYERVLAPRFPRLVYARVTGFGDGGPLAGMPGFDAVAQAMSGLASLNGAADGPPWRSGAPVSDLSAGLYAAAGLLMALVERARSGRGQKVEVSLLDASVSLLRPHGANWLGGGERPRRAGNAHPNLAPYDLFRAGDGAVFVAVGTDRQFAALCAALDAPELGRDPRFRRNADRAARRPELYAALEPLFAARAAEPLARLLMARGVPAGPVLEVPEALAQPQVAGRGMIVETDGYRGIASPLRMSRSAATPPAAPPALSADARAVLAGAGYADAEIDSLVASGAVAAPPAPGA